MAKILTDDEVVRRWVEDVCSNAEALDDQNDKGGHDWHSLWAGFVVALGRPDLTAWDAYMRLGFPAEGVS